MTIVKPHCTFCALAGGARTNYVRGLYRRFSNYAKPSAELGSIAVQPRNSTCGATLDDSCSTAVGSVATQPLQTTPSAVLRMADRSSVHADAEASTLKKPPAAASATNTSVASVTVTVRTVAVAAFVFGVLLAMTAVAGYQAGAGYDAATSSSSSHNCTADVGRLMCPSRCGCDSDQSAYEYCVCYRGCDNAGISTGYCCE